MLKGGLRDLDGNLLAPTTTEINLEPDPDLLRPADLRVLRGDNTKITDRTGWSPTIPIEQTLADLLEFWRQHPPQHGES